MGLRYECLPLLNGLSLNLFLFVLLFRLFKLVEWFRVIGCVLQNGPKRLLGYPEGGRLLRLLVAACVRAAVLLSVLLESLHFSSKWHKNWWSGNKRQPVQ